MPASALQVRAVIAAAGRGERFGAGRPKAFAPLGGLPLFVHGLRAIAALDEVRQIALVLPPGEPPGEVERALADIADEFPDLDLRRAVGGARRQDSVVAGLRAFEGPCDAALVHDAARPFPPPWALVGLVAQAWEAGGAILAVPSVDTVKRSNDGLHVAATLDRRSVWLAQTPQAIRGDLLAAALERMEGGEAFTDESAVLEAMGAPVALVESSPLNFKITRPEDLARAEALLAAGEIYPDSI